MAKCRMPNPKMRLCPEGNGGTDGGSARQHQRPVSSVRGSAGPYKVAVPLFGVLRALHRLKNSRQGSSTVKTI